MRFVAAFYEIDLACGGPEEGSWHYPTGRLARLLQVYRDERRATSVAQRANRLLARLQRHRRTVNSALHAGGRYRACVFENFAPDGFPEVRPHYE